MTASFKLLFEGAQQILMMDGRHSSVIWETVPRLVTLCGSQQPLLSSFIAYSGYSNKIWARQLSKNRILCPEAGKSKSNVLADLVSNEDQLPEL